MFLLQVKALIIIYIYYCISLLYNKVNIIVIKKLSPYQ